MATEHRRGRLAMGAMALLVAFAMPGLCLAGDAESAVEPPTTKGIVALQYRFPGVVDTSVAATVVHCTNIGSTVASVYFLVRDYNGLQDCSSSGVSIGAGETRTFATHETAVYAEDYRCTGSSPTDVLGIQQGMAEIRANLVGDQRLLCTAQVVDPAASPPAYATTLDLYPQ